MKRAPDAARSGVVIRPAATAWTPKARAESGEPLPVKVGPAYQIAIPGFLSEPRVRIAPRVQPRRPARPREVGEAEIVVLYNLALGLERGRAEDLISDAETARVAQAVAAALQGHVRSVELAPVWDDLGEVLRRYDPDRHVIFNLCESLGGRSWSEAEVPRLMRAGGFVHTGSSFLALRRAGNKLITKRTLLATGLQNPPNRFSTRCAWALVPCSPESAAANPTRRTAAASTPTTRSLPNVMANFLSLPPRLGPSQILTTGANTSNPASPGGPARCERQ